MKNIKSSNLVIVCQVIFFLLLTSTYPLEADFFDNYLEKEGKIHLKTVDNIKKILIKDSEMFSHIYEKVKKINPNFITEIAVYIKSEESIVTIEDLKKNLLSFDKYTEIPYFSRQNKTTTPLFSNIKTLKTSETPDNENWLLDCKMRPFGNYKTNINMLSSKDYIRLVFSNASPIFYNGFKAITVDNMLWIIEAKFVDDGVFIYCIGAIKAFDLFGILHERLENSLEGRIEAFFNWNYNSLF